MYYLDAAATESPKKEVLDIVYWYQSNKWFNPSSLYAPSKLLKKEMAACIDYIAKYINAEMEELYFTSGGSESNSWAIQGFVNQCFKEKNIPIIITSKIEHISILRCCNELSKVNDLVHVFYVEADKKGFINLNMLNAMLEYISVTFKSKKYKTLVSIQYANNEIGTVQNVQEISRIVHSYNAIFHTDAVQAFGNLDIDVNALGIDLMSVSGHKIGSPKGIGFLYKRGNIDITPLIFGKQMNGMRGGTENVPYIVGLAKAIELVDFDKENLQSLRDYFINGLKNKLGCQLNGSQTNRLPNNINVTFPQNITGESLIYMLDMCEIYISSGSACNTSSNKPSHVLKAIGLTDEEIARTIRITLSDKLLLDIDDIDRVINEIEKQIRILDTSGLNMQDINYKNH